MLLAGTVMDIPISDASPTTDSSTSSPSYTILFDNGTSASIPLQDMASIIPKPPVDIDSSDSQDSLLPPFLWLNSKITYEHDGIYHKGFLGKRDGVYRFIFKCLMPTNTKKNGGSIFVTSLPLGSIYALKDFLFPVMYLILSFDHHLPLNSLHLIQLPLLSAPSTSIGNALPHSCMPLRTHIRIGRYGLRVIRRKKRGIESLDTYQKITLGEYRALREKGAPKAIPTMCVLTIKKD